MTRNERKAKKATARAARQRKNDRLKAQKRNAPVQGKKEVSDEACNSMLNQMQDSLTLLTDDNGNWDWSYTNRHATYERLYRSLQQLGWNGRKTARNGLNGYMNIAGIDASGTPVISDSTLAFEVPSQPDNPNDMRLVVAIYEGLKHSVELAQKSLPHTPDMNISTMAIAGDKLVFTVVGWQGA